MVSNLAVDAEDAQAMSEYILTIGGYVNQAFVQFVTGELDIEKDWDTYISNLESMGVQDYIQLYQKNYDTYLDNLSK